MTTKKSLVLIGYFVIQFISSCCNGVKYYDFTQMDVQLSGNTVEPDQDLTIQLFATDLKYLALQLPDLGFASSLALNCDDGWGGMKYPFESIEITSAANFNDEYPAAQNLAPLFQIMKFLGDGKFEMVPLAEADLAAFRGDDVTLIISERPTAVFTHQLQLKLRKSNQETITVTTTDITWQ